MIKLEGVSKSYGSIKVLENFSFGVETGSQSAWWDEAVAANLRY